MGKKTNERRKQFFEEFNAKEKLRKKITPKNVVKKPPAVDTSSSCCLDRYSDLPENFRPCFNCEKLAISVAETENT